MSFIHRYNEPDNEDDIVSTRETYIVVQELATEIDACLMPYVNQPENVVVGMEGNDLKVALKEGRDILAPSVGMLIVLANANEQISRYSKWSAQYHNKNYYKQTFNEAVRHFKPEVIMGAEPIDELLERLFQLENCFPFHDVSMAIRDLLSQTNGWAMLFAKIKDGFLVIEDCGDYRIHQWESGDGISFRRAHSLLPAKCVLR